MQTSGKLVILGILALALASAAASWWFRYAATHRAAEFWGPDAAELIRDAPVVQLCRLYPSTDEIQPRNGAIEIDTADCADVSRARGLTHLRNALLEDRSFHWPDHRGLNTNHWHWALLFRDDGRGVNRFLLFSEDASLVAAPPADRVLSCAPISAGLLEIFYELAAEPLRR